MATISTVRVRDALKPRHEPYWHKLSTGAYIGFRKMAADSDGTWIAYWRDGTSGKKHKRSLGAFDQLPAAQRFDAAAAAAREWFTHLGKGGSVEAASLKDVCDRYVKHLRGHGNDKSADDADQRFKNYVLDDERLAALPVAKLTPAIVDQWRSRLRTRPTRSGGNRGKARSDSTLNRDITPFRAALNLALDDGLVTTDFAWRVKLRPIVAADKKRELYLDRDQRRLLIEHAQADVCQFLTALALLPLRPGALAALTVADLDKRLGVLTVRDDKAGAGRRIKLPLQTLKFFTEAATKKLPAAPLLSRADGKAWNKDAWKWPIKEAVMAAKLPPEATAYTLRHSVITDLVHDGLDLLTVAQVAGTSVRMIEAHYGHLRDTVAADALARLAL